MYNTGQSAVVVKDLTGREYPAIAAVNRKRRVNGQREISLSFLYTEINKDFIRELDFHWKILFGGEWYTIINPGKSTEGDYIQINVTAILSFFIELNGYYLQDKVEDKSFTASAYFENIFEGTPYNFMIISSLAATTFSYQDNQSRTTRFLYGIERFKAEYIVRGNMVYLYDLIGSDKDIILHEDLNVKSVSIDVDASGFHTWAKGYGDLPEDTTVENPDYKLKVEYKSPLIAMYGEIEGPSIKDRNYKIAANLTEAVKNQVENSYTISTQIDVVDLSNNGYPEMVLEEGDRVWLYVSKLNLNQQVRVVEIDETFDWEGNLINAKYTIGNEGIAARYKAKQYDTLKDFSDIISGRKKISVDWLPEAIKRASDIINGNLDSHFIYGAGEIIGINRSNPNGYMRFNTDGIGFSRDGGKTYRTAITYEGINADYVVAGTLRGIAVITDDSEGNRIKLENGEIRTYLGNAPVMSVDAYGLRMWHDTNLLAGTLRNEKDLNNPNKDGIELMGHQEYVAVGFRETGTLINNPWIKMDRGPEIDQTTIYGSNVNGSDAGRLDLYASAGRNIGNGRVARLSIRNFNDDETKWGGMINYIGRDYDAPGYDDTQRFGFEIWQYRGTGNGAADQLFKIDKDANGPTAMRVYTDTSYLSPSTYLKSGNFYDRALGIVINESIQVHGVPSGNPVISMYEIDIDYSPGSGYSVKTTVNVSGARYIWAVYIQLRDGSANYFTATPTNISKTGYEIWTTIADGNNRDNYSGTQLKANVMVVLQRD